MSELLSFIIPCYRSEKTIGKVIREIVDTVSGAEDYDYEIICVNDCSPDGVWPVLCGLAEKNRKIKLADFSKNSGKDAALLAGMSLSSGKYIITLDDDCQCPAGEVWRMIRPLVSDECDVATAKYRRKKQSLWKNIGSNVNMRMSRILLDQPENIRIENFLAMKRFVAEEVIKYTNAFPYLDGLILRVTKRILPIEMEERTRGDGDSSGFTLKKSVSLFVNGLTAFSVKPLRISAVTGLVAALAGFVMAIVVLIQKITGVIDVEGYTTTVIVQLIIGGLILMSLGLTGEYIGRIYISINKSPQYVIKEKVNFEQ